MLVKVTAVAAASVYAITGLAWLGLTDERAFGPIGWWLGTLWLVGACSVVAAGLGQERARRGGRVFALSVLGFLVGVGLAAEGLSIGISMQTYSGPQAPSLLHQIGFVASWPVFLLALVEDVFALGER